MKNRWIARIAGILGAALLAIVIFDVVYIRSHHHLTGALEVQLIAASAAVGSALAGTTSAIASAIAASRSLEISAEVRRLGVQASQAASRGSLPPAMFVDGGFSPDGGVRIDLGPDTIQLIGIERMTGGGPTEWGGRTALGMSAVLSSGPEMPLTYRSLREWGDGIDVVLADAAGLQRWRYQIRWDRDEPQPDQTLDSPIEGYMLLHHFGPHELVPDAGA